MTDRPRVFIWGEPSQQAVIEAALRSGRLDLVGVGGPTKDGGVQLSARFEVERVDDLRVAVQRDDVDLLWLASSQPIGADERRLIRETGLPTVSSEPRPLALADFRRDPDEARTAVFAPLMRRSRGALGADDARREFGRVEAVSIAVMSGPGEGTLFARLFDAMDLLDTLCAPAEGIDATLSGPMPAAPESLAELRGHMTVNLRFGGNCAAAIVASDSAGAWDRQVTLLGPRGCLRFTDTGYSWVDADGVAVESGEHADDAAVLPSAGELIEAQALRILDNLDATLGPPPDTARLLALCEAARLSCRTGEGETPQRLLEMLSRP